jgi:hypothetical protein
MKLGDCLPGKFVLVDNGEVLGLQPACIIGRHTASGWIDVALVKRNAEHGWHVTGEPFPVTPEELYSYDHEFGEKAKAETRVSVAGEGVAEDVYRRRLDRVSRMIGDELRFPVMGAERRVSNDWLWRVYQIAKGEIE